MDTRQYYRSCQSPELMLATAKTASMYTRPFLVLFDNTARSQLPPAQLLLAYEGTTQRTRRMIYGLRVIVATPDLGDNPVVQPGVVMVTG